MKLRRVCILVMALVLPLLVSASCKNDAVKKHLKPLSYAAKLRLENRKMDEKSPIFLRIFKKENKLEVWKQRRDGKYGLFDTYEICKWSGELGPKIKEGDRQAPEGFYTVTPGQMNPSSSYYLSFNLGFPNAFDRAHGRTGTHLMVHGDCSSAGCYAMTDKQIGEIYALARLAFLGGQRVFHVHAFPFEMTPENFYVYRDNPNIKFWEMLKEGNDHFETTQKPPIIDVCDKRYVFNATPVAGQFYPTAPCPSYRVSDDIAQLVKKKQETDAQKLRDIAEKEKNSLSISKIFEDK